MKKFLQNLCLVSSIIAFFSGVLLFVIYVKNAFAFLGRTKDKAVELFIDELSDDD